MKHSLLLLLIVGAGGTIVWPVQIAKSYFDVLKWKPTVGKDPIPSETITSVLGGDELPWDYKEGGVIVSENVLPLHNNTLTAYYKQLEEYELTKEYEPRPRYNDRNIQFRDCFREAQYQDLWSSSLEDLKKHVTSFMKTGKAVSAWKGVWKLLGKYLKGSKNTKTLDKMLGKLSQKDMEQFLEDRVLKERGNGELAVFWAGMQEDFQHITENPKMACTEPHYFSPIAALYAVEQLVMERVKNCPSYHDSILTVREDSSQPLFHDALKYIEQALQRDDFVEHLKITVPSAIELRNDWIQLRKITEEPIALLSLDRLRDFLVEGSVISCCDSKSIGTKSCVRCNCRTATMVSKFTGAVETIRNKINIQSNCKEIWKELSEKMTERGSIVSWFQEDGKMLRSSISMIEGVQELLQVFPDREDMESWYSAPYLNLRFTDHPAQHGIWWAASFSLPYPSCTAFAQVQELRQSLEKYSKIYYFTSFQALDRCGVLNQKDPVESFFAADKITMVEMAKLYYRYDYKDLAMILPSNHNGTVTDNSYELSMNMLFFWIRDENTLEFTQENLDTAIEQYKSMFLEHKEKNADIQNVLDVYSIMGHCPACDLVQSLVSILGYRKNMYLNYYEDRLAPLPHEDKQYKQQRAGLDTRKLLAGCTRDFEDELTEYKSRSIDILSSNTMQSRGAFKTYTSYIFPEGDYQTTRTDLIEQLESITAEKFKDVIMMRLEKFGIEEKDDRSTYEDFREFEELYTGKKAPKQFKTQWKEYMDSRSCLLKLLGIHKLGTVSTISALDPKSCGALIEVKEKKKEKKKDKDKNKNKKKEKEKKKNKNKNKKNKNKNKG